MLDEVANGLSFYDYTFLHEVPRLHCALEDRLNQEEGGTPGELASFLTMGSWIGGDRDGNPFVTADVMRGTLRLQSSRVMNFYLEELHVARLGTVAGGASCRRLRRIARAGRALARHLAASKRRTVSPRGVRHLCPADRDRAAAGGRDHPPAGRRGRALCEREGIQGRSRRARPFADCEQFRRDRARPAAVCCAGPWIVSASISPGSISGRIPRCMNARWRNCSTRRSPGCPIWTSTRKPASTLLLSELRSARPLSSAFVKYSEETLGELARVPRRRRGPCQVRHRRDPPMHHLHVQGHVRHAGGGGAAEGGRPHQPLRPQRHQHRAAVRDHRGFAGVIRHHGPDAVAARLSQAGGQPRRRSGSDARLFRQQQGWRLRHLGLGALQGRDRAGRGVRAPPRAAAAVPRPRRLGRPRRRAEL